MPTRAPWLDEQGQADFPQVHVQGPRSLSPGNDGRRISNSIALSGRGSDIAVEAGGSLSAGSEFWTAQEKEQHVLGEIVGFSTTQFYRFRVEEFAFRFIRHLHKTDNAFYSKTFNSSIKEERKP